MKNHGIVAGAKSISEIETIINDISFRFRSSSQKMVNSNESPPVLPNVNIKGYKAIGNVRANRLAFLNYYEQLYDNWALYPDHLVFLGAHPYLFDSYDDLLIFLNYGNKPDVVFVKNKAVLIADEITQAKIAQILCYFDVLCRQSDLNNLSSLTKYQVAEIIDWIWKNIGWSLRNEN